MAKSNQSPYEILNASTQSNEKEIKRSYKRLIRQFTPEHHPEEFMAIRAAYESLSTVKPYDIMTAQFPLYHQPLITINQEDVEEISTTEKPKELSKHLLGEFFETPFNTHFELKKVLEHYPKEFKEI